MRKWGWHRARATLPYLYGSGWLFSPYFRPARAATNQLPVSQSMIQAGVQNLSADEDQLVTDVTWGLLVDSAREAGANRVILVFEDAPTNEDASRIREHAYMPTGMRDEYESVDILSAKLWTTRQLRDVSIWRDNVPLVEMFETWDTFLLREEMAPLRTHSRLIGLLRSNHGLTVNGQQNEL